jgi:putative DNA primase/helicase
MVTKSVFEDLAEEVDQIWAEAMEIVKQGETLYLSSEVEEMAREEQAAHSETDERTGLIQKYLDTKLPDNWERMDFYERKAYIEQEGNGTQRRMHVCIAEVWCECLGKPKEEMDRYKTREINDIMKSLPGWKAKLSTKDFKLYGKQRYFERLK